MAKVTYHAPEGDNRVVDAFGHTFFDGQAVDLDDRQHSRAIRKLRNNRHFQVEGDDAGDGAAGSASGGSGFVARHRGRGVYAVYDGNGPLDGVPGMSKDEADKFNAMSEEDKLTYVNGPPTGPEPQNAVNQGDQSSNPDSAE